MEPVDPIIPLAGLIDATPEECRALGLRGWLARVLAERSAIKSIIALREAAGIGLAEAKGLCDSVASAPAGMEDVITRLERGDLTNAALYLRRHYHVGFFGDSRASERVALALARAFELPWTETEAEVFPPPELETFAEAAGWSIEEAGERGLVAWLVVMGAEWPSVAEVVAVRSATGLAAKAAVELLRVLHADLGMAQRGMDMAEGEGRGELDEELAGRAGCERREAREMMRVFREAFGWRRPGRGEGME